MMDAVEYIKEHKKLCDSFFDTGRNCKECPLSMYKNGHDMPCALLSRHYPETSVAIVERWIKGGPANDKNN